MSKTTVLTFNWIVLSIMALGIFGSGGDPATILTALFIGLLCVANIMYINEVKKGNK